MNQNKIMITLLAYDKNMIKTTVCARTERTHRKLFSEIVAILNTLEKKTTKK